MDTNNTTNSEAESKKPLLRYLSEISAKIGILQELNEKLGQKDLLIAFRGERKDYGKTKLMPSLFREPEYISKETHLFDLFYDYNLLSPHASNIEKAIEVQHYAATSRMLDVTYDALVALYFACVSPSPERKTDDAKIFIFAFPRHYSPHSSYIEEFYTKLLEKKHAAYSRNFKVFSHCCTNERIMAQKGGFLFFPGDEFLPISNSYYDVVTITYTDKAKILVALDLMFRINKSTIYPEKENIADVIKDKFEKKEYVDSKVCPNEEIELCLDNIEYELSIREEKTSHQGKGRKKNEQNQRNKELLRFLRKEENDILKYLERSYPFRENPGETVEMLGESIKLKFKHLKIKFEEL